MKKSSKKTKKQDLKKWVALPLERYLAQADELVTHSINSVNTKIKGGGGVRIIPNYDVDMPYACVRFGRQQVSLDYSQGAQSSVPTEQLDAIRIQDFNRYQAIPEEEKTKIQEIQSQVLPLLEKNMVNVPYSVNPRMRQIMLENGDGGYVSLSPLHSSGFSERLHQVMEEKLLEISADCQNGSGYPAFFDEVVFKVGGDKPQNVGRMHLIGAMQKAYRFPVPVESDKGLRSLIRLYHRGVSTKPPAEMLLAYGQFLNLLRRKDAHHDQSLQRNENRMNRQFKHIAGMVRVVLSRGNLAHKKMKPYVPSILDDFCDASLSKVQKGLMNPSLRDNQWKSEFADEIVYHIAFSTDNNKSLLVGVSGLSAESLKKQIEEVLS